MSLEDTPKLRLAVPPVGKLTYWVGGGVRSPALAVNEWVTGIVGRRRYPFAGARG